MRAGGREPVGSGGQEPERDAHGEHGQGAGLVAVVRQDPERQDYERTAEGVAPFLGPRLPAPIQRVSSAIP